MAQIVIVFCHFGYSKYLEYTLECARRTNPDARLVLLGDVDNAAVAGAHGWEHYRFVDYNSQDQTRFGKVFRHVQGTKHDAFRNGRDWLRFVFERWFHIMGFVEQQNIKRFWHFDSDTMILQDLRSHDRALSDVEFTTQCGGMCLNGVVTTPVLDEYCKHICLVFEDIALLESLQSLYLIHPDWALTEMYAFEHYKARSHRRGVHLLNYSPEVVFDDCICFADGFDRCQLLSGEKLKSISAKGGKFYGIREAREVEFVTLNCSWVGEHVFKWVLRCLDGRSRKIEHAADFSVGFRSAIMKWTKRLIRRAN